MAFSVAGGTGCGIFYDYLYLIGYELAKTQLKVKIYPLVLMPSAFDKGLGGGRAAELNAGRALLDLFRLVDQQNGAAAQVSAELAWAATSRSTLTTSRSTTLGHPGSR